MLGNLFEIGNKTATEAAFAKAAHFVRRRYVISRVYAHFMEPRGAIGVWDPGEDRFRLEPAIAVGCAFDRPCEGE